MVVYAIVYARAHARLKLDTLTLVESLKKYYYYIRTVHKLCLLATPNL